MGTLRVTSQPSIRIQSVATELTVRTDTLHKFINFKLLLIL